jgi:hypothetical protein
VQLIPARMNPANRRCDDDDDDDDHSNNGGQFVFTFPIAKLPQPDPVKLASQQWKPKYCGPARYGDITQSAV